MTTMSPPPSLSSELPQLRALLQELQSVQLPEILSNANNDDVTNDVSPPFPSAELLSRYKSARDAYIERRTLEMFLQLLETHDWDAPMMQESDFEEEQTKREDEVLQLVQQTMAQIDGKMEEVQGKYEEFTVHRQELENMVQEMERIQWSDLEEDQEEEEEDNSLEITEETVKEQAEELQRLQQHKLELEQKLRRVKSNILNVEDDCHGLQKKINEIRVNTGRKPLNWKLQPDDDGEMVEESCTEDFRSINQGMEVEIAEMEEKILELKQSAEFYDGMRQIMEELGGIKILSIKSDAPLNTAFDTDNNNAEKRQKLDIAQGDFILTLMLLESHILELVVQNTASSSEDEKSLRVASAKIITNTTFPMTQANTSSENDSTLMETMHSISLSHISLSKIMSQKQSVSITIPPLDDLVQWSHSLDLSDGIRFVVVETMARIRTLEARVVELTHLRENYAAQIYDIESNPKDTFYGGAEQEVVCAINEGISVALRLGADCPLFPGSVYISELFGVGGWEEEKLEEMKQLIGQRKCKGPVEVMEVMLEVIKKKREEGWVIPSTPSLPRGRYT